MDFEIVVVCLLVILYIIAIVTVCLLVYMCLKVKSNSSSHRNINTGDTYPDNQEQNIQTIQTTSNIEALMDTSIKSDSIHKSDESHIYQELEDIYIDDSIPSNLDSKCKNNNFPEPFYFALDPEAEQCSCEGACSCRKHLYH